MDALKTLGTRLLNGWQLSRLSTFEVAARHESFALAADELALTPSAVSHRINQLEEELGIQLFVRSHRKVELTREGEARLLGAEVVAGWPQSGRFWTSKTRSSLAA
ncbi:LysR family transcriptional regulator [Klebsiella variicola subsp. variicola]|nr:LysR family transcriptional regulator [Klebsiella variicola subsp. variicola]